MYNCELFSARGTSDFDNFTEQFPDIASSLYEKGINVVFQTDITPNTKNITNALFDSLSQADAPTYYIFANTTKTKDSTSFKELFFDFISKKEAEIAQDKEDGGEAKIKISSIGDLGNGYRGYCFKIYDKKFLVLPGAELTGKDICELIISAVDIAESTFTAVDAECEDGIVHIKEDEKAPVKKEKEGFFKSFIPKKSDSKGVKVRKYVVLVAILALIGALGYLINFFIIAPLVNRQVNAEIQEIAYRQSKDSDDDNLPAQDWAALKNINDEIVAWVTLPDTKIDYPVLEHIGDDQYSQYYLNHTYKKDWSSYGSVFLDYRSTDSVHSKNVIIHGHNMNDGSMFHELLNYGGLSGNLDYYKEHPVIEFNTPDGDAKWKIISVFKTNTLYAHGEFFNYMQGSFTSDAEFMNFVYNLRVRSLFDIPVMVNENDQLLTLSTCSYEYSNFRTVVVARKVREGESEKVDTDLATINSNVVFPDVYYSYRGGTRPAVSSFKKASAAGQVSWYDGKGNLKGDETLTGTVAENPTEPPTEKESKKTQRETEPKVIKYYTVNYMNYDGSLFESFTVKEGDSVAYPELNPTMPDDDYYTYTFSGWKVEGFDLQSVHYSMDIMPDFSAKAK
ncbi:MAG: class B sortase [Oscillospiraceae bacterium]|nr:class B sortase [Candidatus Ruminococcus equi]